VETHFVPHIVLVFYIYGCDVQVFNIFSAVGLSPLGTAAISGILYKPQMRDEGDCGVISGIKIGRGTEVLGEHLPQRYFGPPQIPHDQTGAAAVGR
jgi:hypothetical protein